MEYHKITLEKAIEKLPQYEAPAMLWSVIEDAMNAEDHLSLEVQSLPQYEAPEQIWAQLDQRLEAMQPKQTWFSVTSRRWMAAAAAVMVLVIAWLFIPKMASESAEIAVTQTQLNETLRQPLEEPEDDAFAMINDLCKSRAPVCEQPTFKNLKTELEELTEAKTSIKSALGAYGDDPGLTAQLVRIEQQRTDLLRQIIALI
ncbi:MAG: hypothetical protein JNJ57_00820 [Saprospiraceae bacterium]|nr:hypothetical protein [Saprospiraceae bacterium]